MKFLILKDKKITDEQLDELERQFTDLIYEATGLSPVFIVEERDYSHVPLESDSDGDLKPSQAYMKVLMKEVYDKYGEYGVDSVVPLVHQDNWVFTGIWGTNLSNIYYKYHVHLCRFDKKNIANSLGTFYHEWMHCLDALIKTHTGVDVNKYFNKTKCWVNWDSTLVHGNKFTGCKETPFEYIKWKDNVEVLEYIQEDLIQAYAVRDKMNRQKKIITLLQNFLISYRARFNRKQK